MLKVFSIAIAGIVCASPLAAHAAGYGAAGCGLGSVIFDADGSQVSAATTNGSFGSQFFGITSGTLNCADATATAASLDQKAYIRANYANVMRDAAQGKGEYLAAFATVLGCSAEAQPAFFDMTRDNHGKLFADDATPGEVLRQVKQQARQDVRLRSACARI